MIKFFRIQLWMVFLILLWSSCELINPEEDTPAYIYVKPFKLNTNTNTQGSASANISEVWLKQNNGFLGAYNLPALIPVLIEGNESLTLEAGIKTNGISGTPDIYLFYEPFDIQLDLQPNVTDTIQPTTRYIGNTKFAFVEDFEGVGHIFQRDRDGNADTKVEITTNDVFEGNSSGIILLDKDNPFAEVATQDSYEELTPGNGGIPNVYLEIDYKSDVSAIFGIVGINRDGSEQAFFEAGFTPSSTWNKIYFNLSGLFVINSNFERYRIVFQAGIPIVNGAFTLDNATVLVDNIKLVHF